MSRPGPTAIDSRREVLVGGAGAASRAQRDPLQLVGGARRRLHQGRDPEEETISSVSQALDQCRGGSEPSPATAIAKRPASARAPVRRPPVSSRIATARRWRSETWHGSAGGGRRGVRVGGWRVGAGSRGGTGRGRVAAGWRPRRSRDRRPVRERRPRRTRRGRRARSAFSGSDGRRAGGRAVVAPRRAYRSHARRGASPRALVQECAAAVAPVALRRSCRAPWAICACLPAERHGALRSGERQSRGRVSARGRPHQGGKKARERDEPGTRSSSSGDRQPMRRHTRRAAAGPRALAGGRPARGGGRGRTSASAASERRATGASPRARAQRGRPAGDSATPAARPLE